MDRITKLQEFLKTTPKDNFLRHALALEYVKLGNNEEAKRIFIEILTDDPSYVGSYYHLAKLLERVGDESAAITWYEKGMEVAKAAGEQHAFGELRGAYEELTM